MYARVATFEIPQNAPKEMGEKVAEEVRRRITSGDSGPQGAQRVLMLADPANGRALNITLFDTEENMQAAEEFFSAMNPVEIDGAPSGRRTDVARYVVYMDQEVPA